MNNESEKKDEDGFLESLGNPEEYVAGIKVVETVEVKFDRFMKFIINLLLWPFRLLWNIVVIIVAITLEVLWIGFVFGSVAGVILLLIFWIEGFFFPLVLLVFTTELWPENE
jgi:uncharacterized membrane protein|tara:strand:- start:2471 stop:2806 length:336 start_codon:yes stop_codon:yes gene_type:complete